VHDTALVSCVPSDAGGALCRCATNFFGSATIEVDEDPTDSATCQVGFDRCAASIELVPGGDESCELISMATYPENCTAGLSCSRPAIAAGEDVLVHASHFAQCQLDGDVYACHCKGMADGEFFHVETLDSEAACTEAIVQCPDHGSVSYSPGIYQD
ncbi:MAG: hypothetical protein JW940_06360, partial [Polyangiaceae bacterium]|nr:hypothetical protein [Polyangiaceae bacterium]